MGKPITEWKLITFPEVNKRLPGLVAQGDIRIAVKPQYIDKLPKFSMVGVRPTRKGGRPRRDGGIFELLGISHIIGRNMSALGWRIAEGSNLCHF